MEGGSMQSDSPRGSSQRGGESFVEALAAYSRFHRAQHWSGTFGEFLRTVVPGNGRQLARTSHEYLWDMLCWFGRNAPAPSSPATNGSEPAGPKELFKRELFGIDEPLSRVVDYFKAAAAGSDVGRRLLLLLGPPSGGKSTLAILLKRGLEEYSRTDEGALYAIKGSPMHESPMNLVPASLRRRSGRRTEPVGARAARARVRGRLSPRSRAACVPERGPARRHRHL